MRFAFWKRPGNVMPIAKYELLAHMTQEEFDRWEERRTYRMRILSGNAIAFYSHYQLRGLVDFCYHKINGAPGGIAKEMRIEGANGTIAIGGLWSSNPEFMESIGFPASIPITLFIGDSEQPCTSHMSVDAVQRLILSFAQAVQTKRPTDDYLFCPKQPYYRDGIVAFGVMQVTLFGNTWSLWSSAVPFPYQETSHNLIYLFTAGVELGMA